MSPAMFFANRHSALPPLAPSWCGPNYVGPHTQVTTIHQATLNWFEDCCPKAALIVCIQSQAHCDFSILSAARLFKKFMTVWARIKLPIFLHTNSKCSGLGECSIFSPNYQLEPAESWFFPSNSDSASPSPFFWHNVGQSLIQLSFFFTTSERLVDSCFLYQNSAWADSKLTLIPDQFGLFCLNPNSFSKTWIWMEQAHTEVVSTKLIEPASSRFCDQKLGWAGSNQFFFQNFGLSRFNPHRFFQNAGWAGSTQFFSVSNVDWAGSNPGPIISPKLGWSRLSQIICLPKFGLSRLSKKEEKEGK